MPVPLFSEFDEWTKSYPDKAAKLIVNAEFGVDWMDDEREEIPVQEAKDYVKFFRRYLQVLEGLGGKRALQRHQLKIFPAKRLARLGKIAIFARRKTYYSEKMTGHSASEHKATMSLPPAVEGNAVRPLTFVKGGVNRVR